LVLILTIVYANKIVSLRNLNTSLIHLDSDLFDKYILSNDRTFSFFLFFTSSTSFFECPSCKIIHPIFEDVSRMVFDKTQQYQRDYFFGVVELKNCEMTYRKHKSVLSKIPMIAFIPPKNYDNFTISDIDKFVIDEKSISFTSLGEFVNRKSGKNLIDIPKGTDYSEYLPYLTLIMFATVAFTHKEKIINNRREPSFWFLVCLGIVAFAYCGMIYNVNRGTPLFYFSPDQGLMLLYPGIRNQFLLESFVMGSVMCAGGVVLVALVVWVPKGKNSDDIRTNFSYMVVTNIVILFVLRIVFTIKARS